jgi:hypothetical protein
MPDVVAMDSLLADGTTAQPDAEHIDDEAAKEADEARRKEITAADADEATRKKAAAEEADASGPTPDERPEPVKPTARGSRR